MNEKESKLVEFALFLVKELRYSIEIKPMHSEVRKSILIIVDEVDYLLPEDNKIIIDLINKGIETVGEDLRYTRESVDEYTERLEFYLTNEIK